MGELSRNLAIGVYGCLELNLHNQNQSAIADQIVVRSGRACERKLSVGAESTLSSSNETILLAGSQVGAFNALPVGMRRNVKQV